MTEGAVRLNVKMNDKDLHDRAKARATLEGRTLSQVVRDFLEDYARPDLTEEEILRENIDRQRKRLDAMRKHSQ